MSTYTPQLLLTPSLCRQAFIRNKAIADAKHLYAHLQPLRSSPSGNFASPTSPKMPTYEEFTTPRSHASLASTPASRVSTLERVKRHSRKISNSFTKGPMFGGAPGVYHQVGTENEDAKYEMRALMDPSETVVVPMGKMSGESFSVGGSEIEDRDSGKVVKF
jgi:hypothetical protein